MLHEKLPDYKIINISLPLHNNAPSLHNDNKTEWSSVDIEYMFNTLCEEYNILKCILIGSAFTGYPMIGFRLNNPSLVNCIVSSDWILKPPEIMIKTEPKILFKDLPISDFRKGMVQRLTDHGKAPKIVIDHINETLSKNNDELIYKQVEYFF